MKSEAWSCDERLQCSSWTGDLSRGKEKATGKVEELSLEAMILR